MKVKVLIVLLFFSSVPSVFGQSKVYYNQTELGVLAGKKPDTWDGQTQHRVGFSFLTFHGAKVSRHHALGFSVGLDQYEELTIVPIALGWRGFLGKENRPQLIGGLDLGGGYAFLEKKEETEWYKSWYQGGILISPSLGAKFPGKKGKTALTLSVAYKRQELAYFQGYFENGTTPRPFSSDRLPEGYNSINDTSYLFHSLVARMGFIF